MKTIIHFNRLGRSVLGAPEPVTLAGKAGPAAIMGAIDKQARKRLRSSSWEISLVCGVDEVPHSFYVEGGRYGDGTIEYVE